MKNPTPEEILELVRLAEMVYELEGRPREIAYAKKKAKEILNKLGVET